MKIIKSVMGYASSNTYFIEKDNHVVVIDPCLDPNQDATRLLNPLKGKIVSGILITHGHFDHISGIDAICEVFDTTVYVYHEEAEWLKNPSLNLSTMTPEIVSIQKEPILIDLGYLNVGQFEFEVISTAGHTAGSVSYRLENDIFDGDFIFQNSVGRMDLPTGSGPLMTSQIEKFIDRFEAINPTLYPGHGEPTTLKTEIKYNPFIKHLLRNT